MLKPTAIAHRTYANGYHSEVTVYECEDCSNCPLKSKCTKAQGNRKMKVSKKFIAKHQISYKNIISE